jgi:glycosyltransferase involved in cell wall biosynthesis
MIRIGFDGKRFFHNNTGLGNYSRNLIKVVSDYFPDNEYLLYNPKKNSKYTLDPFNTSVIEILPKSLFSKKLKSLWRLWFVSASIEKNTTIFHGLSGEIPLGLSKKIKKVVTIHDLIFLRYPNLYSFFDRKIHFLKFKYAAQKSDIVVAISEQTKNDIITYLGISEDKIKVIYQGCDPVYKENYSENEKTEVIKRFHLPQKFILNVGTIETRKNAFLIVKAIQGTTIPLVLVGRKTAYCKEIDLFISENNMQNQVIYIHKISQNDLAILYQTATIFVYPSIFEGFGIPIIEALYSKTPVITTNSGVFPEAGGPDSIYVNPNKVSEMRDAILEQFNNEALCLAIAAKGYDFVQKFNDAVIAKNWQNLYESLL